MRISAGLFAVALVASSASFIPTTASFAASKTGSNQATSWDGKWSGKWNGGSSSKVTIKNNKVTSYYFRGYPQKVGSTKVSGQTIRFGAGYSVTMKKTGPNSASAVYVGDGTAHADMKR